MTNVTVQEALKSAIEAMEYHTEQTRPIQKTIDTLALCKSALSEIEKCEPVAEAIRERDRLGFAVVNVIGKLDEIIENTQEVEIDDFLHIAIPIDKWHELQDALEEMPKRAELYTSPISKEWVGLTDMQITNIGMQHQSLHQVAYAISDALKQLNAEKG